jgi:hypothetical protein
VLSAASAGIRALRFFLTKKLKMPSCSWANMQLPELTTPEAIRALQLFMGGCAFPASAGTGVLRFPFFERAPDVQLPGVRRPACSVGRRACLVLVLVRAAGPPPAIKSALT